MLICVKYLQIPDGKEDDPDIASGDDGAPQPVQVI